MAEMLTAERLREVVNYDPDMGAFTFLAIRVGARSAGGRSDGYRQIRIDGGRYLAHRLAWLYMTGEWPALLVDHKNGNPRDNRFTNLRECDDQQNRANSRLRRNNKSGWMGVSHRRGKWAAFIGVAKETKYLGSFDCPAAAHLAYVVAGSSRGEFARFA